MSKCIKHCVVSYKESDLLPSEQSCMRHCVVKAFDLNQALDNKVKYYMKTL